MPRGPQAAASTRAAVTPGPDTDVAVLGAGIVGLAVALEVQRRGRRVALIAPDDPRGRASFGNAGVVSLGSILPVAGPGLVGRLPRYLLGRDPAVRIRPGALPAAAPWAARFLRLCNEAAWRQAARALAPLVAASLAAHEALAADLGCAHRIRRHGYLRVWREEGGLGGAALEREILREHGVATEALSADAIAEIEPHLARRYACGLLATDSASIHTPGDLLDRMERAFLERGGTRLRAPVRALAATTDGVTLYVSAGECRAAHAVVAAGARSAPLALPAGDRIPLAAERGYHREVALAGNATLTRPVHDAAGGFVMAPMDGRIRVTSGVELARPDDPPDHAQIHGAFADAGQSLPFAPESAGEIWMGSRPSTPDSLPVIGVATKTPRVVYAFGHGHIGLSTGPVTGRLVADLLDGKRPDVPLDPFSPRRFREAATR
ncbi:FAD-dependent oxidoreductase [uncultured Jannaschia sp.]|uniref:NAD(P)/FAD-dependent oxidoreductase n=1 Tax=uncultured Jannaschia sp. TaxID=293347 RepID=UPI00260AF2E1|nr:FAD-dependent oxidoreductase [uncultured Jannaschia sp.]